MSSQVVSRHDRRKQATRRRILEAAVACFAARGYDATTVAEICAGADVARQTFFNHFAAKRDLLVELLETGVDVLAADLAAAFEQGRTSRERIAHFFAVTVASAVDVGPFNRDLVAHVIHSSDNPLYPEQSQRISDLFVGFVRRGLEVGAVTRRHPPEVLAELIEGSVFALMRDWSARGGFDRNQRALEMAAVVADAVEARPDER